MRYRKRPLTVEAIRNWGEWTPIIDWLDGLAGGPIGVPFFGHHPPLSRGYDGSVVIETPEGPMRCEVGSWIIRGIEGELYPCLDSVFTATYEPAPIPVSPA